MADRTHIEWTDATWNPITGCSVVSSGCTNCYAMRLAGTRLAHHPSRAGLTRDTKAGPVWTGEVRFNAHWLRQPLRWAKPRMIFVCAHGDLFHENVPDGWIDQVWAVMALAPWHVFQVLTKRAGRMRDYLNDPGQPARVASLLDATKPRETWNGSVAPARERLAAGPLPNVWAGVSVEDQRRAEERIGYLMIARAAVRWISAEPLLGPVDLTRLDLPLQRPGPSASFNALTAVTRSPPLWPDRRVIEIEYKRLSPINWVVVGGESGPGARPMHLDWARSLRDQCAAAGVPFLFKQWGAYAWGEVVAGDTTTLTAYRCGKAAAGRVLDGVVHDAFPPRFLDGVTRDASATPCFAAGGRLT